MTELTDIEIRRKKALFRAQRRGFRELDRFEALLSVPDWQMFDWVMGHVAVPRAYDHEVFARLCAYRNNFPS